MIAIESDPTLSHLEGQKRFICKMKPHQTFFSPLCSALTGADLQLGSLDEKHLSTLTLTGDKHVSIGPLNAWPLLQENSPR